jgi:glycerol-3-phosphate acyltransferase PlsY
MFELAIKSLTAYLLGAIMGSLVIGRLSGGVDIRRMGSGNAGGTNALRTQGALFALGVVVIDVLKGWFAARWLPNVSLPGLPIDPMLDRAWLTGACGLSAILGHIYPVWYDFRGGKGAATLVGVTLGTEARLLLPALGVWIVVVLLTGFVGLATIAAALTLALTAVFVFNENSLAPITFFAASAAVIIYAHRDNVARMLSGTENRARRLWLFGR